MRIFFVGPRHAAGFHVLIFYINVFIKRTMVCGETYLLYVAAENPRRTPHNGKKTIYGWKLINTRPEQADIGKINNTNAHPG
jgi:hypothetical protein